MMSALASPEAAATTRGDAASPRSTLPPSSADAEHGAAAASLASCVARSGSKPPTAFEAAAGAAATAAVLAVLAVLAAVVAVAVFPVAAGVLADLLLKHHLLWPLLCLLLLLRHLNRHLLDLAAAAAAAELLGEERHVSAVLVLLGVCDRHVVPAAPMLTLAVCLARVAGDVVTGHVSAHLLVDDVSAARAAP